MRRAVQTAARALRDFALGIHLANGIRHGVPQRTERPGCLVQTRQPGGGRPAPGESITPAFTQAFTGPAAVSSARV
ncbi:hypothetical protein ACFWPH_04115 [Nocardia sp. NPDC058499]|uniref:hypothetical protein n=1 Tax=Nocardia sp. NPDC058499 TaxID=3346530 RepID=UPI00365EB86F